MPARGGTDRALRPARTRSAATVGWTEAAAWPPAAVLDHDPLGPGQPVGDLLGQRVVAGDQSDRDAPRAEDQRVQAVLAGRPAVQARLDRRRRSRCGRSSRAAWPARA